MTKSLHFLYHELRPARSRYAYVTPCAEFEEHCALFARVRQMANGEDLIPEVTFDDGNSSDVQYAAAMLQRHDLQATFFITAGWTGCRSGFMDWPQIRELHAAGHRIGAHGMTHKLLTACSDAELHHELGDARRRLEDGLGVEVQMMSLPGGRANGKVFRACRNAGYRQIFTSVPRAEDLTDMPMTVGRLNLLAGTTIPWLEGVLRPATGALARLERMDRFKTAAKHLVGDRVYAGLWALVNRQERTSPESEAVST